MSSKPHWIFGRHVVEESLEAPSRRVIQLLVLAADRTRHAAVVDKARRAGARVRFVERSELDRTSRGEVHQGLAAQVFDKQVGGLTEFLSALTPADKKTCLIVALDEIQDPHNLGAIARSAVCLGARVLITPERRTAPITQTVLQASAGAIQKLPTFAVGNLAQTLLRLKDDGFWVYGADAEGKPVWGVTMNFPMVLVVGSEGKGMRPLVRSYCDELVAIPQAPGGVSSLNASCAASVLLYEAARQKSLG
ncbi:MAG: 23S rRNA (guanosine(2251)-2'-O)-methyltransferase RlmB [Elusimicrobia bacterium]|nr:23S rRNA (guanosine(2251)-2'-O)-methyltransferase RlmB [Elusimicrobiota bacterium]